MTLTPKVTNTECRAAELLVFRPQVTTTAPAVSSSLGALASVARAATMTHVRSASNYLIINFHM